MSTGEKTPGTEQEAATASATAAAGAPGAPKTTRRPLERSTHTTRSRPSKRVPRRAIWPLRSSSDRRPVGTRASMAARRKAPAGAPAARARGATGASGAAAREAKRPSRAALESELAEPGACDGGGSGGRESVAVGAPVRAGRRGCWPAARFALTMAPAEVPTKAPAWVKSNPVASSIPARTPLSHASPRIPPAPSTRTSGRTSSSEAGTRGEASGGG